MSMEVELARSALGGIELPSLRITIVYGEDGSDPRTGEDLANILRQAGITVYTPKNISAGAIRRDALQLMLEEAHFILVLCSQGSLTKRGVYHQQIAWACQLQELMPEGATLIMPLLLDDCSLPAALSSLTPLRTWEPDAWRQLLGAWIREWQRRTVTNDWN